MLVPSLNFFFFYVHADTILNHKVLEKKVSFKLF